MKLEPFILTAKERLNTLFEIYLQKERYPAPQLQEAMIYSVLNGGKRIRPLLVYLTGHVLGSSWETLDAAAAAIELVHVYSLIHDDLPAMDNSDLRRGKPTCHTAFNEALAILAGDTLQSLAFEIIAKHPSQLDAVQRLQMVRRLAEASGLTGMAAGQTLDLIGTRSLDALNQMYHYKTGALLSCAVELGTISINADFNPLKHFAETIGLAFQIQDDLLDVEGTQTGKPQGIDALNNKVTYPTLLGVERCREEIKNLFAAALSMLDFLGPNANLLREFCYFLMDRKA